MVKQKAAASIFSFACGRDQEQRKLAEVHPGARMGCKRVGGINSIMKALAIVCKCCMKPLHGAIVACNVAETELASTLAALRAILCTTISEVDTVQYNMLGAILHTMLDNHVSAPQQYGITTTIYLQSNSNSNSFTCRSCSFMLKGGIDWPLTPGLERPSSCNFHS